MRKVQTVPGFSDEIVIYHSRKDRCWIAHSLRTDQIGTGGRIVDALADAIRAVQQVVAEAVKDPTLVVLRDAPTSVQKYRSKSQKLPREIYEIAHKMVHGEWPADLDLSVEPKRESQRFTATFEEVLV